MAYPITTKVLNIISDQLPVKEESAPCTKAQALYWGELCRLVALKGPQGMGDADWDAGMQPTRQTLRAMEERGLVVRRKRAWHVKRTWHDAFAQLKASAIPTPRLVVADAPGPGLPTYAELESWQEVALYLDCLPGRKERFPFAGLTTPYERIERMRAFKLLQHRRGCFWQLYSGWKDRLQLLWRGKLKAEAEQEAQDKPEVAPTIVAAGIDTWYLNVLDEEGIPLALRQLLDDLQRQAQAEECEMELDMQFDDMPLVLYQTGLNAQQGGGVSWSYVLRNASVGIRMRRTALKGIVAQVRLGSECLWRLTPAGALTEIQKLFRRWWASSGRDLTWQVSQVHLAVDIAGVNLDEDHQFQYVSRSKKRTVHQPGTADLAEPVTSVWDYQDEQEALYGSASQPLQFASDPWMEETPGWETYLDLLGVNTDEDSVEDRAMTLDSWGRRVSGITWSAGQSISMVLYDKTLEARIKGKRHMQPIWEANGVLPGETVTRHEARFRKEALNELETFEGERGRFDDPWDMLAHQQDLWAYQVGRPPEVQTCPEEADVAWIRRVIPQDDSNRSRWPTELTWELLQSAKFMDAPPEARRLIRRRLVTDALDSRVKTLLGALVSCTALQHADTQTLDISTALHEVEPLLRKEAAKPEKRFDRKVRDRRRKWGKPLSREDKILPFAPNLALDQPEPSVIDTQPEDELDQYEWLIANADRRIQEAELALEEAQTAGLFDRNHNLHTPSDYDLERLIGQIDLERQEQTKLLRRQTQLLVEQGKADAQREQEYRVELAREAQQRYEAAEAEMNRLQRQYDLMAGDGEHWRERFKVLDQLEVAVQTWIEAGLVAYSDVVLPLLLSSNT